MKYNIKLAKSKGRDTELLDALYAILGTAEAEMTHSAKISRALLPLWHEIQFSLQDAWGFNRDKNYHRDYTLPFCACPVMDNDDWLGTDKRIYILNCPIHGKTNADNQGS